MPHGSILRKPRNWDQTPDGDDPYGDRNTRVDFGLTRNLSTGLPAPHYPGGDRRDTGWLYRSMGPTQKDPSTSAIHPGPYGLSAFETNAIYSDRRNEGLGRKGGGSTAGGGAGILAYPPPDEDQYPHDFVRDSGGDDGGAAVAAAGCCVCSAAGLLSLLMVILALGGGAAAHHGKLFDSLMPIAQKQASGETLTPQETLMLEGAAQSKEFRATVGAVAAEALKTRALTPAQSRVFEEKMSQMENDVMEDCGGEPRTPDEIVARAADDEIRKQKQGAKLAEKRRKEKVRRQMKSVYKSQKKKPLPPRTWGTWLSGRGRGGSRRTTRRLKKRIRRTRRR